MNKLDFKLTIAIAVVAVLATATRFDVLVADDRIFDGEMWRAITGPFVHATWGHLVRDVALVAFLGIVYEAPLGRSYPVLVALGLVVPAVVVLVATPAAYYTGLSGLSHALFGAAIGHELIWRRGRARWLVAAIGVVLLPKIGYELITGTPAFAMDLGAGVRQVPHAHAAGVAIGLAFALLGTVLARARWAAAVSRSMNFKSAHCSGRRRSSRSPISDFTSSTFSTRVARPTRLAIGCERYR